MSKYSYYLLMGKFTEYKDRAITLRKKGMTFSEINSRLRTKIPKGTLSLWCAKVSLPGWYVKKVKDDNKRHLSKALKMACDVNKKKRETFLESLKNNTAHLSAYYKNKDVMKLVLSMLYLGEGTKWKGHRGLTLGSSDPDIIKLYIGLLKLCYGVEPSNLKCRVSYRADQNITKLETFWSKTTRIPKGNFYKTIPDPRTIGKPTKKIDYKGVCVIMGGSTKIQLELDSIARSILVGL